MSSMSRLLLAVVAVVLLVVERASAVGTTCVTCASPRLNPTTGGVSWSVTGLSNPAAIPDANFFDTCGSAFTTNTIKTSWIVACDSYCISMYVTDIALAKQAGKLGIDNPLYRLYVRGCASKLLGYTPSAAQTPADKACSYGERKYYDQTNALSTGYQYLYQCKTTTDATLGCNYASLATAITTAGAPQTACAQNVRGQAQCKQCESSTDNCDSGSCSQGDWCVKTVTNMNNDIYTTSKTCAPMNVRVTAGCQSFQETRYQQTRSLAYTYVTQCYCNTHGCNGASAITAVVIAPLLAALLAAGWSS